MKNQSYGKFTDVNSHTSYNYVNELQSVEQINSTGNIMKMKILQHSNSRNPFCQECGKTGHQTGVCSTIGACFYYGKKHNALQC